MDVEGRQETEVVHMLARDQWGNGFATEAARAARDDALGRLFSMEHPDHAGR